jgi:DNA-binding transcriptional regulator YiaG
MANIAAALKEEITRVSRKELRKLVDPIRRQLATQRRDIAALKRERDELERQVTSLAKTSRRSIVPVPEADTEKRSRFSAAGLRTLRQKLGLSADDLGRLAGVSGQSVYNWEQEKSRPRQAQVDKIAPLRNIGKREAHRLLSEHQNT